MRDALPKEGLLIRRQRVDGVEGAALGSLEAEPVFANLVLEDIQHDGRGEGAPEVDAQAHQRHDGGDLRAVVAHAVQGAGHEAQAGADAGQDQHAEDEVRVAGVQGDGEDGDAEGLEDGAEEEGEEGLAGTVVHEEVGEQGAATEAGHVVG